MLPGRVRPCQRKQMTSPSLASKPWLIASNISLWQEDGKKLFPAFKEKNSRLRIRKHSRQTSKEPNCLGHLKRSLKKHLPMGGLYAGALHVFSYLRSTRYCRLDIISLVCRLKNWEVTYPVQGYTAWVCECQSQDTQLALGTPHYTVLQKRNYKSFLVMCLHAYIP